MFSYRQPYGYGYPAQPQRYPSDEERLAAMAYSPAAQRYRAAPPPDQAPAYNQAQPMAPQQQREAPRPATVEDEERQRYAGGLAAMRGRW